MLICDIKVLLKHLEKGKGHKLSVVIASQVVNVTLIFALTRKDDILSQFSGKWFIESSRAISASLGIHYSPNWFKKRPLLN